MRPSPLRGDKERADNGKLQENHSFRFLLHEFFRDYCSPAKCYVQGLHSPSAQIPVSPKMPLTERRGARSPLRVTPGELSLAREPSLPEVVPPGAVLGQ